MENTMQKTGLRRGLTTAQLKWIALVLMVLDHIHYFFEFTGAVPLLFSQLGRLSAGLFLFCLIEGFIHTHDRRRYFLRIYLVSVGMGAVQFCCILFDFCRRPDGFYPMNQMLATFAVLLPMLQGVDWLRQKRWLRGLAALVLPFAWPFFMLMVIYPMFPQAEGWLTLLGFTVLPMHTMIMDGGTLFILCGLLMYLCRLKSTKLEALAFAAFYLLVYGSTAVLYPVRRGILSLIRCLSGWARFQLCSCCCTMGSAAPPGAAASISFMCSIPRTSTFCTGFRGFCIYGCND